MESFSEKFMRYLRIWLILGLVMVIAACVTHWDTLRVSFSASLESMISGGFTIAIMIAIVAYMIRGHF